MFVTPGSFGGFGRRLTHDAAERLARNWTTLLLNGILLVIAGVLIFSIDWSVSSLSTFIGALFIFEGVWAIITVGGIWAAVIGAMRIVYAFELRRLPEDVDQAFADHSANGATGRSGSERHAPASAASSS